MLWVTYSAPAVTRYRIQSGKSLKCSAEPPVPVYSIRLVIVLSHWSLTYNLGRFFSVSGSASSQLSQVVDRGASAFYLLSRRGAEHEPQVGHAIYDVGRTFFGTHRGSAHPWVNDPLKDVFTLFLILEVGAVVRISPAQWLLTRPRFSRGASRPVHVGRDAPRENRGRVKSHWAGDMRTTAPTSRIKNRVKTSLSGSLTHGWALPRCVPKKVRPTS